MGDKKKMRKKKKRPNFILGFDETNNGFNLDSRHYIPHDNSPLVVTGYLTPEIGASYGNKKYEAKKKIFNSKRDIKRALKRGRYYIENNPYFFYTTFSRKAINQTPLPILKANAIALLTFQFFNTYDINPDETQIILDQMDDKKHTSHVIQTLGIWLEDADINSDYRYKKNADKNTPAVKTADRVGYYISAIKFLGDSKKWPYRSRKIPLSHLERLTQETRDKRFI